MALHREIGSQHLGWSLCLLGVAELHRGLYGLAVIHFKECLQLIDVSWEIANSLAGVAGAILHFNQPRAAALLLGAVKQHLDNKIENMYRKDFEHAWSEAQKQLGESEFMQALSEGAAMSVEQAVSLALSISIRSSD